MYYGSAFNDLFKKNKDSLNSIEGVYCDLEELYTLYFNANLDL